MTAYTDTPTTTNRKPIGDLEIYAAAKPGTAAIFMMLDTSGSMDKRSIRADYPSLNFSSSCSESAKSSEKITPTIYGRKAKTAADGSIVTDDNGNPIMVRDTSVIKYNTAYTPKGCETKKSGIKFSRMERLKLALIELLADDVFDSKNALKETGNLPDDYEVGVGNFGPSSSQDIGVIRVPTRPLTPEQRMALIEEIKTLSAVSWTPTAHALAESGAYMMGTNTNNKSYNSYSGFADSVADAKTFDKKSYESPLNAKECSGNGIYLLTDGEPNRSSDARAKAVMNASLSYSNKLSVKNCNGLSGGSSDGAWGCMAEYAALLRNIDNNPYKLPIKTATVGFGKDFAGLNDKRSIIINGKIKDVVDCDKGSVGQNTKNLCKLGERRGDDETKTFGDGGFYYTEESADIAASIVDFASGLVQIINTAPSGTITVPDDPYQAANQMPFAYLPMLDPDINSAATIWRGNLKKYSLNQGTLYGKSDNLLYEDAAGNLNAATQDLWQKIGMTSDGKPANNNIAAGGVYAQLKSPKSGLSSVRNVYIEDVASNTSNTPTLRKIGVNNSGAATGFADLVDPINIDELNKRRLLSFLGFDNIRSKKNVITTLLDSKGKMTDEATVSEITMLAPSQDIRILGGVVHSTPTVVSYGATLDDYGRITDDRDDYVLFGSMDGALHLVDAKEGKEEFAIIPKVMLQQQPTALVDGSIKDEVGTPYFGVDAPWLVKTDYKFDLENKKVKVDDSSNKGMFAYGGLRMGGVGFYGIDITKKTEPKIMFTITAAGRNNTTSQEFVRLGQIWSKPTAAKIRLNPNADPTDVIIFGGGYDMQYEDDNFAATAATPAKGNAVFIVDALTGKLLWSASSNGSSSTVVPEMIHSITGEVTVLDRNNDGLMDHLYVADLGGQVFRADFENARPAQGGSPAISTFKNKSVTRILNASADIDKKYAYRFYSRPLVSFYRAEGGTNNGKIFALINVISGNRSAPLSKLRNDNKYANRLYGIIDSDITRTDLYDSDFNSTIKDLKEANLVDLNAEMINKVGAKKQTVKDTMITGTKKGWYYPLTRFDGYNNVRHNKGMGDMATINNILFTTIYNPDKVYGTVSSCAARIVGGSERQMYCLPYGICMDDTSITGTGGFMPAGQGIHELTLGAYNAENKDIKVLIGTTTITDRIEAAKRSGYNQDSVKNSSNIKDLYPGETIRPTQVGGDGSAAEFLFNERYTLQPTAWYEQKVGE
ncbi:pilus assembly protein [Psychrobacter ciconiae]|uniref:PilC/PilY family type IV pilus protein n=1 Tax=Psychrobacter ciconiae TaxID=1553449 RepID=UPI0019197B3D|nr:PilC/PilY family type IV pilus protein [Psychrobacter ciconiae]